MSDFDTYFRRYGESVVQEIVERIERNERRFVRAGDSLEERWNALMRGMSKPQKVAA